MELNRIKNVALNRSADEIEQALERQLRLRDLRTVDCVDILTKAKFVRTQLDNGLSMRDALRELGRRMRMVAGA